MKNLFFFVSIFFLFSCAKSEEQLVDSAKQIAKRALSDGKCSEARKALEEVGHQSDDPIYIALLASSHACYANYSELDLFNDIDSIASGADAMLGSLTLLSTSNETQADSAGYKSIMSAIDIIVESGGGSAAGRSSKFGSIGGMNLNFQALWLILTELGKFMEYYGNADAGAKGAGTAPNKCLFTYDEQDAKTYIDTGPTGPCVTGESGHADLPRPPTAPTTLARLCEGIYLFNNFRDILANTDFGDDERFASFTSMSAAIESALDEAETNDPGTRINTVRGIYSKEACEELNAEQLEVWYAVVFETAFP